MCIKPPLRCILVIPHSIIIAFISNLYLSVSSNNVMQTYQMMIYCKLYLYKSTCFCDIFFGAMDINSLEKALLFCAVYMKIISII